jgi:hypothetical protein
LTGDLGGGIDIDRKGEDMKDHAQAADEVKYLIKISELLLLWVSMK